MKPFLAIFSVVLAVTYLQVVPGTAYTDRAALGARLIRGLNTRTHVKKPTSNEDHADGSASGEQDTLSKDMENQMKRIDALEDIFIGSSGSRGENGSSSAVDSARRSSVDETKDLDKDLSKLNEDDDDAGTRLEKRNEVSSYDGGDVDSPKEFGYEESTVEKANSRRRREVAAGDKAGEDSRRNAKNASKGKENESRDSLLEQELADDDGTGFSDKTDSASASKKSEIPGTELAKSVKADDKDSDSGADLMGGTGAIAGDLESDDSDDKGQHDGNHGDEGRAADGDDRISENGNGDSEKRKDDGKPEYGDDDKKSENDDDGKSENNEDWKPENEDDGKSENGADKNSENVADKNSENVADKNSENVADQNSENVADKNSENVADKNSENVADESEDNRKESENGGKSDDAVADDDDDDDDDGDFEKNGEKKSKIDSSESEESKNSPKPDVDESKFESKLKSKLDDVEDDRKSDSEDRKSNYVDNKPYGDESSEEVVHATTTDSDVDSEKDGESKKSDDDAGAVEETKGDAESDSADKKVTCRTMCTPPMDYETCAVPRCDYKVGTIKDLCQYLCHHQKERCQEVCD